MFHFPAFPPTPYEFGMQVTRHDSRRVTPFGHPGITARLTAPPGLSQPPTSFIGPWYQGIHRPPLPTYPHTHTKNEPQNTKMLASTMQISTHHQPTTSNHPTRDSHQPCLAPRQQPQTHPTGHAHDHQTAARLFSQNLNRVSALPPNPTRPPHRSHHPRSTRTAVPDAPARQPDPTRQRLRP
jgi:hypothetical protein